MAVAAAAAGYVGGDLIVYLMKLVYGRNKLKNAAAVRSDILEL